jgi:hypothetical protein
MQHLCPALLGSHGKALRLLGHDPPGHESGPGSESSEFLEVEAEGVSQVMVLSDRRFGQHWSQLGVVRMEQSDTGQEIRPYREICHSQVLWKGTPYESTAALTSLSSADMTKFEDAASRSVKAISGSSPIMLAAEGTR